MNTRLKSVTGVFFVCFYFSGALSGQTLVTQPMSGTPAGGSYYSPTSITFSPGFSFTATRASSFQAYIISPDNTPLATKPSSNQNYILTSIPRVAGMITTADLQHRNTGELMQSVQYIDGLGRPLQTVQVAGSPLANDLVSPVAYDQFGREVTKFLPYTFPGPAVSDGSYRSDALIPGAGQSQFYASPPPGVITTPAPWAVSGFEPSPLNRIVEQGAPGVPWQPAASSLTGSGHTQKVIYSTNNTIAWAADNMNSMQVALFGVTMNPDLSRTLTRSGNTAVYGAGQLTVTINKDENWISGRVGTTEDYKDNEGHTVLKRVYSLSGSIVQQLSTYYVYDDFGNLAFVLPPGSMPDSGIPGVTTLSNVCYQYQYDGRGRLVQKKIPGKGWDFLLYNVLDQVVGTQDSSQRSAGQWLYSKYDGLGRVVVTGLYTNTGSRPALQMVVNSQTSLWELANPPDFTYLNTQGQRHFLVTVPTGVMGYSSNAWPGNLSSGFLKINYYDSYAVPGLPLQYAGGAGSSTMTRGLLTASLTRVLGTSNLLWAVFYYDDLGRVIQTYQQHNQGGGATLSIGNYDVVASTYDFTNELTASSRQHFNTAFSTTTPAVSIANSYTYDHMGRKKQTWESINGGTNVLISQLDYNELGQLRTKHLHSENTGAPFLQDIGFTYNERGWLRTQGNSTNLFSLDLRYNTPDNGILPQYNGNISEMLYMGTNSGAKTFQYQYDPLNRLTSAVSTGNTLNETIAYDIMGNITSLNRLGGNAMSLGYTYKNGGLSNQLQTVTNGTAAFRNYTYDGNGNAQSDGGVKSISYNLLNLPLSVSTSGKTLATYTYDAAGSKLRTVGSDGTWDYINGIVYTNNSISFIQTEEGRALPNGNSFLYQYYLKDHLGNTWVTVKKKLDGTAGNIQENEYYSFGLAAAVQNTPSPPNRYLYNGKEVQTDLSNQYDYGARFYDPVIGRFTTVDAYGEKYHSLSPYQYGANNPIRFIDINGDSIRVSEQLTNNFTSNQALNQFAGTKTGRAFLGDYASKGQTIGGQSFDTDGKYSKEGIDINYGVYNKNDEHEGGQTSTSIESGRLNINIGLNINANSIVDGKENSLRLDGRSSTNYAQAYTERIFRRSETLFHESFIHGNLITQDYLDNGKLDNSNISIGNKQGFKLGDFQHNQVYYNQYNQDNLWPNAAFRGLINVNSRLNLNHSASEIKRYIQGGVQGN